MIDLIEKDRKFETVTTLPEDFALYCFMCHTLMPLNFASKSACKS